MSDFLDLCVTATASGCIYGLVALSYLLMIRPTGIINFAVGEWAAVGAFGAFTALTILALPWLLAVPFVIVGDDEAAAGLVSLKPLRGQGEQQRLSVAGAIEQIGKR